MSAISAGPRNEHLAQNENRERLARPEKVVGKFGVGPKDALATFDRRSAGVRIRSSFDHNTTAKQHKHCFGDITTLHAVIADASDPDMVGTDVELSSVVDTTRPCWDAADAVVGSVEGGCSCCTPTTAGVTRAAVSAVQEASSPRAGASLRVSGQQPVVVQKSHI